MTVVNLCLFNKIIQEGIQNNKNAKRFGTCQPTDFWGRIPHQLHMEKGSRLKKMAIVKSSTCGRLRDWVEPLFKILPVHDSRSMVKEMKRNCGPRKTRMSSVSYGRGWGEGGI